MVTPQERPGKSSVHAVPADALSIRIFPTLLIEYVGCDSSIVNGSSSSMFGSGSQRLRYGCGHSNVWSNHGDACSLGIRNPRVVSLLMKAAARDCTLGAVARRRRPPIRVPIPRCKSMEHPMYIGGGILGSLLLVLLIVYLVRRV